MAKKKLSATDKYYIDQHAEKDSAEAISDVIGCTPNCVINYLTNKGASSKLMVRHKDAKGKVTSTILTQAASEQGDTFLQQEVPPTQKYDDCIHKIADDD